MTITLIGDNWCFPH